MKKQKREEKRKKKRDAAMLVISMVVLHREFGFGEKRLGRFYDACAAQSHGMNKDKLKSLKEELIEVTGWGIEE